MTASIEERVERAKDRAVDEFYIGEHVGLRPTLDYMIAALRTFGLEIREAGFMAGNASPNTFATAADPAYVRVPREPTATMLEAAVCALKDPQWPPPLDDAQRAYIAYRAMLAALTPEEK